MAYNTLSIGVAAVLVVLVVYHTIIGGRGSRRPKSTRIPPGPKGKPIVGNLLDIPPYHSWLKFKEWSDEYGPLMRLSLGGNDNYVISSEKVANDLLRERGHLYSSREQLPAAAVLLSDNLRPLMLPYNDVWRKGRRLMHLVNMPSAAATYEPTQKLESVRLLEDLIRSPEDYETWFSRYAASLIFRLAFGKIVSKSDEGYLRRVLDVVHTVERVASPGAYLVDQFPVLMRLPDFLAPFKRELKQLHRKELALFRELLEDVRVRMEGGKAPECWEKTLIEKQEELGLSTDQGAYVVGTLFEAGSSTTAAAMMSFMLAMVHHPEWMEKLQREVDRVVGAGRLPQFDDMPNLPAVRATVKETLRWRPVTAGGVPHQLIKDDVYEGMFLPAGSTIHWNLWAISRDPDIYPDPESFRPERWLQPKFPTYKEPLTTYPNLVNYQAFGFGRRLCPGQHITERSMNILVARIAWACDISKKTDASGAVIDPPLYDYTPGFNTQPKWFPFDLKARSEEKVALISEAVREAKATDPLGGQW